MDYPVSSWINFLLCSSIKYLSVYLPVAGHFCNSVSFIHKSLPSQYCCDYLTYGEIMDIQRLSGNSPSLSPGAKVESQLKM